jgi:hypothetical protein
MKKPMPTITLVATGAPQGAAAAASSAQFPLPGWPLFRLGFRPFYLGAAAFALFAVPYWIAGLLGWWHCLRRCRRCCGTPTRCSTALPWQ